MPNVSLTVYLKEKNGHYAKYNSDRKKYNKIGTMAIKDALDVDTIIEEKDLLDEADNQPEEETDNILEEVPIKEVIHIGNPTNNKVEEKKSIFNVFKRK